MSEQANRITPTSSKIASKLILSFLFSATLLSACRNENEEELFRDVVIDCKTTELTWAADIEPIMQLNCSFSGCHGNNNPSAGINLSSEENTLAIPKALLLGSINHEPGFYAMPPTGQKLSPCAIDQITAWLNENAE
ncbi:MAG: c-type cytochrome [Luteibaculaceae bacterium]